MRTSPLVNWEVKPHPIDLKNQLNQIGRYDHSVLLPELLTVMFHHLTDGGVEAYYQNSRVIVTDTLTFCYLEHEDDWACRLEYNGGSEGEM